MATTHTQFLADYKAKLEELGFEGLTKADIKVMVDAFGETIADDLREQLEINLARKPRSRVQPARMALTIKGIGRWRIDDRPARKGRNPATGESIDIAASKQIKVGVDKAVSNGLNDLAKQVQGKSATPIKRRA
jgi:DNA-binding protein HU-beta